MKKLPLPESGEILVGVDGSAVSGAALRWAVDEGARSGRDVRALHAWTHDPLHGPQTSPPVSVHDARVAQRQGLEKLVHALVGSDLAATIRFEVARDTPANALVRASHSAAMLVLGSHGYGKLLQLMLGSVSSQCVREAACPVVIIPARTVPEDDGDHTEALAGTYLPGPLL
ncbi:universal stress protein [Amycolatopsis magusensis]|uniref:Nucleotide-binding universal stress UspA family protein n=1 Tax=Amycolatopsis magusensis TaxID=882444 RepID=A0ABS4PYR5_9PSEU|nr:universal stress protein [Amycolatopsis magusensis]MBP2183701.1 nucleotide-binding universal stress UspA family protein [Amycolatopsis magusensis]